MNQKVRIMVAIITVLCLVMVNASAKVMAASSDPDIAGGSWSRGTQVEINLEANPAPYTWIQLLTKGVKITTPGELCHEFRGGQYKWIADIRQLVNGKWIKVPTTQGWLKGEEAPYMACAQAPSAGTYAFFGYYSGAPETKTGGACPSGTFDEVVLNENNDGDYFTEIIITANGLIGQNLQISNIVLTTDDLTPEFSVGWSDTETVYEEGLAYFSRIITSDPITQISFTLTAPTCSQNFTLEYSYIPPEELH